MSNIWYATCLVGLVFVFVRHSLEVSLLVIWDKNKYFEISKFLRTVCIHGPFWICSWYHLIFTSLWSGLWYFQFVHFKELRRNAQSPLFLLVFSFANRAEPRFQKQAESSELEGRSERGIGAGPAWLQVWSLLLTSCTAVSPSVEWAPALLRDMRIKWASLRGGLEWRLATGELATSFSLTSHLRSDSPPQAQPPQVKNQEGDSLGGVRRGGPRSCADWRQHSLAQRSF